jgi:hypothetical protein
MDDLRKEVINIFNNYKKDRIFNIQDIYNDFELDVPYGERKIKDTISRFLKYLLDSGYSLRNEELGKNGVIEYKRIKEYVETPNIRFSSIFMCEVFNKYLSLEQKFTKDMFFELSKSASLENKNNIFTKEELVLFRRATDDFLNRMIRRKIIEKTGVINGRKFEYIKSFDVRTSIHGPTQRTHYSIQLYKIKVDGGNDILTHKSGNDILTHKKETISEVEEIPEVETISEVEEIPEVETISQIPSDCEESPLKINMTQIGESLTAYTDMLKEDIIIKENTIEKLFTVTNKKDKIITELQEEVKYTVSENTQLLKDNRTLKVKIKDIIENPINRKKEKELEFELSKANMDFATLKLKVKEYDDKIKSLTIENENFKEMNEELEKRIKNKSTKKLINITEISAELNKYKKKSSQR